MIIFNSNKKSGTVSKSLKYSVVTKHINFDPTMYHPKTIIVNGALAIRLKDNIYRKS
jgi:hypothetical protein